MRNRKISCVVFMMIMSIILSGCNHSKENTIFCIDEESKEYVISDASKDILITVEKADGVTIYDEQGEKVVFETDLQNEAYQIVWNDEAFKNESVYKIVLDDNHFTNKEMENIGILYVTNKEINESELEYRVENVNVPDELIIDEGNIYLGDLNATFSIDALKIKKDIAITENTRIYINDVEYALEENKIIADGLDGTYDIKICWEYDGNPYEFQKSVVVREMSLFEKYDDETLLAIAKESMTDLITRYTCIPMGAYYKMEDLSSLEYEGLPIYRVIDDRVSSLKDIEDEWYRYFASAYEMPKIAYKEIEGKLYSLTGGGLGGIAGEMILSNIVSKEGNEVRFHTKVQDLRDLNYYDSIDFTLVYENGKWKYGKVIR